MKRLVLTIFVIWCSWFGFAEVVLSSTVMRQNPWSVLLLAMFLNGLLSLTYYPLSAEAKWPKGLLGLTMAMSVFGYILLMKTGSKFGLTLLPAALINGVASIWYSRGLKMHPWLKATFGVGLAVSAICTSVRLVENLFPFSSLRFISPMERLGICALLVGPWVAVLAVLVTLRGNDKPPVSTRVSVVPPPAGANAPVGASSFRPEEPDRAANTSSPPAVNLPRMARCT